MIQQGAEPSFEAATQAYLAWMARFCSLDEQGLKLKQAKMRDSPFAFLRSTFYRWSHHFTAVPDEVRSAPSFLIVGDIHLENFGTWRDREGRLVWGINDFDEAADTILEGYWAHLKFGPDPFILEDRHAWLRDLASASGNNAQRYWRKLLKQQGIDEHTVPEEARELLRSHLPMGATSVRFFRRPAGLGSLGRSRFMAVAEWCGGLVAREAKAAIPSAVHVAVSEVDDPTGPSRRAMEQACRAPDPALHIGERWVVRRLSPEARKVEIDEVEHAPDQKHLLHAMGRELANVHLGSAGGAAPIRSCLERLPDDWLRTASCLAATRVQQDYETFLRGS
jgi:hypothetical protein